MVYDKKLYINALLRWPAIILYVGAAYYPELLGLGRRIILAFIFLILTLMLGRLLTAAMDIYQLYPVSAERPIKGYVQLGKLLVYLLGAIIIVSILTKLMCWFPLCAD